MTPAVDALCREVWQARRAGRVPCDAVELGRRQALAVAADVAGSAVYDPEADARVMWLRELGRDLRQRPYTRRPVGSAHLEFTMEAWILPDLHQPCGKDRAAGTAA